MEVISTMENGILVSKKEQANIVTLRPETSILVNLKKISSMEK